MNENTKTGVGLFTLGVIIVLLVGVVFGSFGTIDAGERGVHTRNGRVVGMKDPGLYFKLPFIDSVNKYNTKTQVVKYEREEPLAAASSDLQDVQIATVVNYHIVGSDVGSIYAQFGDQEIFEENVVRPAVRDIVKATASQYTAEELVTKRPEFTAAVGSALNARLAEKFVIIEQVNITNFQFL